jgi:hypothetical protein
MDLQSPKEFISTELTEEEALLILEAAFQLYEDGNLFEWFSNTIQADLDYLRPAFEKAKTYINQDVQAKYKEYAPGYLGE